MKKYILTIAILSILFFTGCTTNQNVDINNDISNNKLEEKNDDEILLPDKNDGDLNENYINYSKKTFKDIIPKEITEYEYVDLGKLKLNNFIYDVKCLNNPDEGFSVKFYMDNNLVKEFYFSSIENKNVEEDEIFGYPLLHETIKDIIIYNDKYLLVLIDNEISSLTYFDIYNSELDKLETILETDKCYEYKIENDKFYYSNNETDYAKGINDVDKYYKVNYVLTEENNELKIKEISREYENIDGPAGQS